MGGIGTLPMDFGQPLQVSQPMMNPSFGPMQPMSNSMLNYGQTPLTMMGGGITRLGYQEGGMDQMMMEPQMQEQMMQPPMQDQMMQAPMQGQMMPAAGGGQPDQMQGQTALLTIIQLLIEQGIDPETAKELAAQILEAFAQGGAPAVEEFANQLEQEEMQQEPMMMAGGGIITIRQGAKFGKIFKSAAKAVSGVVKGVASAVKSIAKSPIGMIALSIAAPYAIGAMFPGFATLGTASLGTFGGAALRAGISNLAIQGITTGKINPKQALMAAVGGGIAGSVFGGAPTAGVTGAEQSFNTLGGVATPTEVFTSPGTLSSGVTGAGVAPITGSSFYSPTETMTAANVNLQQPNLYDKVVMGTTDFGTTVKDFGTKLMSDPVGTLKTGIGSIYDTATQTIKDNPLLSVGGAFLAGQQFRAPLPGEDPNEYNRLKAAHDAEVAGYITQYGRGAKVFSPGEYGLYAREKAIDPFAGLTTYAADGGYITNRQNYFLGKRVSAVATPQSGGGTGGGSGMGGMMARLIQQNPQMFKPQGTTTSYENRYRNLIKGDFIDENMNGIDDRQEASYGGRIGYAEGSIDFERKTLERKGYGDMMKNMTPKEISQLYDSVMGTFSRRFQAEGSMPMGEPRRNLAGIMELDYRAKGGFVPPIGIKEKADDIPAMLSNNEFVFTADAVRAAGGGSVQE
jgi:hypothetical protein